MATLLSQAMETIVPAMKEQKRVEVIERVFRRERVMAETARESGPK